MNKSAAGIKRVLTFRRRNRRVVILQNLRVPPLNLKNLADDSKYQSVLATMRGILRDELIASRDLGLVPEIELIRQTKELTPFEAAAAGRFDFARYWLPLIWWGPTNGRRSTAR